MTSSMKFGVRQHLGTTQFKFLPRPLIYILIKKVDPITMAFRMKEHSQNSKSENGMVSPLFLYVSFNAAHTPLQSEIEWLQKCSHIPHLWRRNYCGLMVGLDQAVDRLVEGEDKGEKTYRSKNWLLILQNVQFLSN